jgi:hypothetical protein
MLSRRALSDIVGLRRQDAWTKYACASAAGFARAYLKTRPVPLRESPEQADAPASSAHQEARGARLLEFDPLLSFRFASDLDESSLTALDEPQSPRSAGVKEVAG